MSPKLTILLYLLLPTCSAEAQPRYTPVKRATSIEAFGASQGIMLALETPFLYRRSFFLNAQAGLGLYRQTASVSTARNAYSFGSALTHCTLLNRRKASCDPRPEYHRWEYYFEAGLAGTLFPDRYKLPDFGSRPVLAAAQALAGFRIHRVGTRNVQIIKLRFSPFLAPGFPLWGGIAYGVGLW